MRKFDILKRFKGFIYGRFKIKTRKNIWSGKCLKCGTRIETQKRSRMREKIRLHYNFGHA